MPLIPGFGELRLEDCCDLRFSSFESPCESEKNDISKINKKKKIPKPKINKVPYIHPTYSVRHFIARIFN